MTVQVGHERQPASPIAARLFITIVVAVLAVLLYWFSQSGGEENIVSAVLTGLMAGILLFVPVAAGLWCGTSSRSLAVRIMGLVIPVAVTSAMVAASAESMSYAAVLSSTMSIALAVSIWATTKMLSIFVLRREKLTIAKMIVIFVVVAVGHSWLRACAKYGVFEDVLLFIFGFFALILVIGCCAVSVVVLYSRSVVADVTMFIFLNATMIIVPTVATRDVIPLVGAVFISLSMLTYLALMRLSIELGIIDWSSKNAAHDYFFKYSVH